MHILKRYLLDSTQDPWAAFQGLANQTVRLTVNIEVADDLGLMAKGQDPQLGRAVQEVMRRLSEKSAAKPQRPLYENRSPIKK